MSHFWYEMDRRDSFSSYELFSSCSAEVKAGVLDSVDRYPRIAGTLISQRQVRFVAS